MRIYDRMTANAFLLCCTVTCVLNPWWNVFLLSVTHLRWHMRHCMMHLPAGCWQEGSAPRDSHQESKGYQSLPKQYPCLLGVHSLTSMPVLGPPPEDCGALSFGVSPLASCFHIYRPVLPYCFFLPDTFPLLTSWKPWCIFTTLPPARLSHGMPLLVPNVLSSQSLPSLLWPPWTWLIQWFHLQPTQSPADLASQLAPGNAVLHQFTSVYCLCRYIRFQIQLVL